MGFVAVLIAALAGFGTGAAWYMILARPWMKAAGMQVGDDGKPQGGGSPLPFVISGIAMLLVAGMMRHAFAMSGVEGAGMGLTAGLGIGAFFIAPWVAMNYGFAMRPKMLSVIDGGYAIVGAGAIGLVLGLF